MRRYPVIEIFGPTIQGEGPAAGERCYFVRLGGCDYRCSWCDTMYAVTPSEVRENAMRMTGTEVARDLRRLGAADADLVILSGGNPALHHADELMDALEPWWVHVETQGTVWRPWLRRAGLVVVSPKPPSAFTGFGADRGVDRAVRFVREQKRGMALKFVAFDERDVMFAAEARRRIDPKRKFPACISAGTPQDGDVSDAAVRSFGWLVRRAVQDDTLAGFRVGMQLHALTWRGERGK